MNDTTNLSIRTFGDQFRVFTNCHEIRRAHHDGNTLLLHCRLDREIHLPPFISSSAFSWLFKSFWGMKDSSHGEGTNSKSSTAQNFSRNRMIRSFYDPIGLQFSSTQFMREPNRHQKNYFQCHTKFFFIFCMLDGGKTTSIMIHPMSKSMKTKLHRNINIALLTSTFKQLNFTILRF